MNALQDRFEASRMRIGLGQLPCDVFADAAFAVRFTIGGEEPIYLADHRRPNGAYIENAVDRALTICKALPAPDLLRIDCPEAPAIAGLPQPDQCVDGRCYWDLRGGMPFLTKLLREVIRSELDPAGLEDLTGHVFLLNSEKDVLFCLYDDRMADVAAADQELLRPAYLACRSWVQDGI